ncbi:unnamed protein product [Rhodiola kirilowii]
MVSPAAQHARACGLMRPLFPRNTTFSALVSPPSPNHISSRFFNLNRPNLQSSSLNFHGPFSRCLAASPPPPDSSDTDLVRSSGLDSKFLRLKDQLRIFFAVLFWMSLFFWACVWDDKNSGNPTKGSRFRR